MNRQPIELLEGLKVTKKLKKKIFFFLNFLNFSNFDRFLPAKDTQQRAEIWFESSS